LNNSRNPKGETNQEPTFRELLEMRKSQRDPSTSETAGINEVAAGVKKMRLESEAEAPKEEEVEDEEWSGAETEKGGEEKDEVMEEGFIVVDDVAGAKKRKTRRGGCKHKKGGNTAAASSGGAAESTNILATVRQGRAQGKSMEEVKNELLSRTARPQEAKDDEVPPVEAKDAEVPPVETPSDPEQKMPDDKISYMSRCHTVLVSICFFHVPPSGLRQHVRFRSPCKVFICQAVMHFFESVDGFFGLLLRLGVKLEGFPSSPIVFLLACTLLCFQSV
jgi:hypothetical protein